MGEGNDKKRSTLINFLVSPNSVDIEEISCSDGKVTITGSGFGDIYAEGSDLNGVSGSDENCTIESWSDSKIVASCGAGTGDVTVRSVFGENTADAACGGTDDAGRPKWWSIWSWWSSWSWSRR